MLTKYFSYEGKDIPVDTLRNYFGKKAREDSRKGVAIPQDKKIFQIVLREHITNRIKLSPLNNSRGSNVSHSAKLGQFGRRAFNESGEFVFDRMFDFQRNLKDTMHYTNTMRNGTIQDKAALYSLANLLANTDHVLAKSEFPTTSSLNNDTSLGIVNTIAGALDFMPGMSAGGPSQSDMSEEEKRKLKRRRKL